MNKLKLKVIFCQLIEVMKEKNQLSAYLKVEHLNPNSSEAEMVAHMLEQVEKLERINKKIVEFLITNNSDCWRVIFGETPQSFFRSIYSGDLSINKKNSFLNIHHLAKLDQHYSSDQTIPEFLGANYNTIIFDVYLLPIPTTILKNIRKELRERGILTEIMEYQSQFLNRLLDSKQLKQVKFISRYKCILPEASELIRLLNLEQHSFSLAYDPSFTLSGGGGFLHQMNFNDFIKK
jgi:hypothetical protein